MNTSNLFIKLANKTTSASVWTKSVNNKIDVKVWNKLNLSLSISLNGFPRRLKRIG